MIYYGDEIGMGDNFYLGDRNGVRTPMQWSGDRNAGFSRANPQRLYLPVIIDPEYHYEAINVETQQNNPHSLLWWMKRVLAQRKQLRALGRGSIEFLYPENRRILAFVRSYEGENVLVVANLSHFAQCGEMDLSKFQGMVPQELFGKTAFPAITDKPYFLSLGPHAFYWFALQPKEAYARDPAHRYRAAAGDRRRIVGERFLAAGAPCAHSDDAGVPARAPVVSRQDRGHPPDGDIRHRAAAEIRRIRAADPRGIWRWRTGDLHAAAGRGARRRAPDAGARAGATAGARWIGGLPALRPRRPRVLR